MFIRLCTALLALIVATAATAAPQTADVIIRHATIVDVAKGRTEPGRAIVIRGDDIVAVGADAAIARRWTAKRTVDAANRFVMPGLWDMHVHFGGGRELIAENRALLPLYLAYGITTVRDCAGDLAQEVLAWRDEIARGDLLGPTLLTSGPKLEGLKPMWKGTIEVGSEADTDKALAQLKAARADFVKITDSTLDPRLFLYAVNRAKALGLNSSGHIPLAITVDQAVAAGLSSIEHLEYAYRAGAADEPAAAADFAAGRIDRAEANRRIDASFDKATAIAAYRRYAKQGLAVTPTLNGSRIIAWLDSEDHSKDPFLAYIGPGLRKTYEWRIQRAAQADAAAIADRHARFDRIAAVLPMLQAAGVPIMAGTDAGFLNSFNYPGQGLHDELALFVRLGLTPAQALDSATRTGPAWFGKDARYGAIAKGKAADILLLDRNPLQDIAATRSVHAVLKEGRVYERAALDTMLSEAKAKVAAWDATAKP
ncbi:amidohydrolase family protein [Sphingoaurantiacus capsulatus]|uniref:Amidohydrolase family protein n=1 Tax=Sphingoaurantiacus capsulatus TaxID=1771310 RepID=A0ABV7XDI1_9SPHN